MPEPSRKPSTLGRAADAGDLTAKWTTRLRTPITSPRIAAMAADAGLSCLFWSIVQSSGLPFAEIALPAGTEEHAVPIQLGTFRIVSESVDLARAAAVFRARAVKEFAAAPGLPATVRLYLPWFCVLPSVESMGVPLTTSLARAGLAPGRIIAEVVVSSSKDRGESLARADALKESGLQLALRVEDRGHDAVESALEVAPDYIHIVEAPASFEDAREVKTFLDRAARRRARVIIGNVSGPDDAAHVDGLGVSLFYGDAISAPRFLC